MEGPEEDIKRESLRLREISHAEFQQEFGPEHREQTQIALQEVITSSKYNTFNLIDTIFDEYYRAVRYRCISRELGEPVDISSISIWITRDGTVSPSIIFGPPADEKWQLESRRFNCWRSSISYLQFPVTQHSSLLEWNPPEDWL